MSSGIRPMRKMSYRTVQNQRDNDQEKIQYQGQKERKKVRFSFFGHLPSLIQFRCDCFYSIYSVTVQTIRVQKEEIGNIAYLVHFTQIAPLDYYRFRITATVMALEIDFISQRKRTNGSPGVVSCDNLCAAKYQRVVFQLPDKINILFRPKRYSFSSSSSYFLAIALARSISVFSPLPHV